MKRVILAILTTCLLFASGCTQQAQYKDYSYPESLQQTSVALVKELSDSKEVMPYCAGVWIQKNLVITAGHCVDQAYEDAVDEVGQDAADEIFKNITPLGDPVYYLTYNDVKENHEITSDKAKLQRGTVIAFDRKHDLALIETNTLVRHPFAKLNKVKLYLGQHVGIIGMPATMWFSFSEGYIAMQRNMMGATGVKSRYIQINSVIWFGNSGGGAFNLDGDLIGICSFVTRAPSMGFFIHQDSISYFLMINKISLDESL